MEEVERRDECYIVDWNERVPLESHWGRVQLLLCSTSPANAILLCSAKQKKKLAPPPPPPPPHRGSNSSTGELHTSKSCCLYSTVSAYCKLRDCAARISSSFQHNKLPSFCVPIRHYPKTDWNVWARFTQCAHLVSTRVVFCQPPSQQSFFSFVAAVVVILHKKYKLYIVGGRSLGEEEEDVFLYSKCLRPVWVVCVDSNKTRERERAKPDG